MGQCFHQNGNSEIVTRSSKQNHKQWECPKINSEATYKFVGHNKRLIYENQQQSVQQELNSTRGGERGVESRVLHSVCAGESSISTTTDIIISFATPSTTKLTVAEIWEYHKTCGDSQETCCFIPCETQWFQIFTCFM